MVKGWFIGDFEPSILKTKDFEVGLLTRYPGKETPHYHAIATEYNILVSGKMIINDILLEPYTIFIIEPNEIVNPDILEECKILCVKVPSVPEDKYEVL